MMTESEEKRGKKEGRKGEREEERRRGRLFFCWTTLHLRMVWEWNPAHDEGRRPDT